MGNLLGTRTVGDRGDQQELTSVPVTLVPSLGDPQILGLCLSFPMGQQGVHGSCIPQAGRTSFWCWSSREELGLSALVE